MNTQQTIIEKDNLISHKIKLLIMTPVFIGGGENSHLDRNQYILDTWRKNRIISILDEKKWANFLCGKNRINKNVFQEFIDFLAVQAENIRSNKKTQHLDEIYEWLKYHKFEYRDYNECIRYSINAPDDFKKHDIHCFIKGSNSKPYLPGSSIKGAIRTAILFNKIKEKGVGFRKRYLDKINKALKAMDDFDQIFMDLNDEIFWNLPFEKYESKLNIHCDVFRGIQISDSTSIDFRKLELLKKIDLSTIQDKRKKSYIRDTIPLYREYLTPGAECHFTLTLDKNLLKNEPIKDVHSIIGMLEPFRDYLIGDDSKILSSFKKLKGIPPFYTAIPNKNNAGIGRTQPNICLGGGTGFLSKTVIHALTNSKEEADDIIKRMLDMSFEEHKHHQKDTLISPRTLKLAKTDKVNLITGWCNIQEA